MTQMKSCRIVGTIASRKEKLRVGDMLLRSRRSYHAYSFQGRNYRNLDESRDARVGGSSLRAVFLNHKRRSVGRTRTVADKKQSDNS